MAAPASLLGLEPRAAEAIVKEPDVEFEDAADELHSRAGGRCCCVDQFTNDGTPLTAG